MKKDESLTEPVPLYADLLDYFNGNRAGMARALGVNPTTVYQWLWGGCKMSTDVAFGLRGYPGVRKATNGKFNKYQFVDIK